MQSTLTQTIKTGLVGGLIAVFICVIGMFEAFNKRDIIGGLMPLGATVMWLTILFTAFLTMRHAHVRAREQALMQGLVAGAVSAAMLCALLIIGSALDIRGIFTNITPALLSALSFDQNIFIGLVLLLVLGALFGLSGAVLYILPARIQHALLIGLIWVITVGVLQELIRVSFSQISALAMLTEWLYVQNGLALSGAVAIFVVAAGLDFVWATQRENVQQRIDALPQNGQRAVRALGVLVLLAILLLLPQLFGIYIGEVLSQVGLYVLMGLGLNIVVGFTGLLDLGYVAFFAIGAYTIGVLTATEHGIGLSFWEAVPVAIVVAIISGFILGIPVLKIRGDYLAIVTMGFGEIIRLLALSDFLKTFLGGSQGINPIPKAQVFNFTLGGPIEIYYLLLACCLIVAFIAIRLKGSRVGRAWMAIREDEDVAQAIGIDLIAYKLLAFGIGAAFAGISGSIFATKISAIYPHSFKLDISINVLALLIIGGMGSIPGVVVGALALIGLPELLREFEDFRLLIYGAALVLMMQLRPEGFWPEATRERELHAHDAPAPTETVPISAATD